MQLPRLREWRERRGMTQADLSEKAGVSRDGISNYENGERDARRSTARKLAQALSVTVDDLTTYPVPRTRRPMDVLRGMEIVGTLSITDAETGEKIDLGTLSPVLAQHIAGVAGSVVLEAGEGIEFQIAAVPQESLEDATATEPIREVTVVVRRFIDRFRVGGASPAAEGSVA